MGCLLCVSGIALNGGKQAEIAQPRCNYNACV